MNVWQCVNCVDAGWMAMAGFKQSIMVKSVVSVGGRLTDVYN